ncbi:hypothetical protein AB0F72_09225 [Actinoplanes sp. NPDC023936]|uniref:hypothetical protein n=1 Tax=Actinoplanes sp. NPDC023936 TaxID=3154910 RepID=UPI003410986F
MDDGFDDHPKVVALLDEDDLTMAGVAIGLWTLCWSWAHRNTRKRGKTPGLVPPGLPRRFLGPAGKEAAQFLVKHRLWDEHESGGWLFHDFGDYLPTEETREARAEAGRRGAAARWAGHQKATDEGESDAEDGNLPSACHEAASKTVANDGSRAPAPWDPTPAPTPGEPTDLPPVDLFGDANESKPEKPSGKPAKRPAKVATRIPDDFAVDDAMRKWAAEKAKSVALPSETENFIDYWQARAKDDTKKDWVAAWRTWMRNAQSRLEERGITRAWTPDGAVMPYNSPHRGSSVSYTEQAAPPRQSRSPADQRVAENQDLYRKYRDLEEAQRGQS